MMKKIILLAVMLTSLFSVGLTPAVYAQSKADVCEGVGLASGSGCDAPAGSPTVDNVLKFGLNTLSVVVGIVAVIMIMVSGIRFVTSGGDAQKVASAKNGLLYAVIGLAVAALAQIIVQFVLKKATK
jgi:hypothetical protein